MRRIAWLTRTRIAILLAAAVAAYLLFAAAGDLFLTHRLNEDEEQLQRETVEQQLQRDRLIEIRDYLKTDAYIENVARNVLGLVRPGESLVLVSSSAPPATPTPDEGDDGTGRPWWERLYGR